jgi:hypothetical protein
MVLDQCLEVVEDDRQVGLAHLSHLGLRRRIPVTATLLEGDDAEAAYRKMVALAQTYSTYRGRTDREIRVFRLAPIL